MRLFFDLETTGKANMKTSHTDPRQPYIVQLGALLTDDDGTERSSLNVIIRPQGWTIPKEAADIHGITTEMAAICGIPIESALSVFTQFLRNSSVVVAHNIDFDFLVICSEFHRKRKPEVIQLLEASDKFCTMRASTDICQLPGLYGFKWPKLTEAHKHFFGMELEGAHDAMTDLRACARIYFELQKLNAPKTPDAN